MTLKGDTGVRVQKLEPRACVHGTYLFTAASAVYHHNALQKHIIIVEAMLASPGLAASRAT